MPLVFTPGRPLQHDEQDERLRLLGVERRTHGSAAAFVTGHGDVSPEDAELIARDLAIADALTGGFGLGPSDSFIFDQIAAAQRGNSFADTEPMAGTVYLSTTPRSRLGRVWDRLCGLFN